MSNPFSSNCSVCGIETAKLYICACGKFTCTDCECRCRRASSAAQGANYVQEVRPRPDDPGCHVCGAVMVPSEFKCLSCKATTGVASSAAPSEREAINDLAHEIVGMFNRGQNSFMFGHYYVQKVSDMLAARAAVPPAPGRDCNRCKLYHDHDHQTKTGGKWAKCRHNAYLGTDHCEICEEEAVTDSGASAPAVDPFLPCDLGKPAQTEEK